MMIKVSRCDDHLGPIGLQHVNFFLAHLVRDREDATVSTDRCSHRQPKPGIARGALDNGAARFEQARLLSPLYHVDRHSIFNRARWIKVFHFGVNGRHVRFNNIIESDKRGSADQINHAFYSFHKNILPQGGERLGKNFTIG